MNRHTVLVVEDMLVNRKILRKLLQEHYDVVDAENGAVAWDILTGDTHEISAVLLDIIMPVMNGYEFLAKIQAAGLEDIPIIVTTGATDEEAERRALDAGAWDYVTKPYNAKVLFSRLRNAIARSELAALETLKFVSEHDELTGLYNRRMMFSETRKMIDEHPDTEFVFVRFDIDRFSLYNTSFGEKEGDRLLRYMAQNISEMAALSPYSACGRISADIIFLAAPYSGSIDPLVAQIRRMQDNLAAYRQDYRLELSAGICVAEAPALSVDEYYFRASVAAQLCKNQISSPYAFYDADIGKRIAYEVSITNEMQAALDEHQFVLYLQPKFRLPSEKVCGAEALVRWQHPARGMIPPGDFIPAFEKNGFISKLDLYVLEETCRLLHIWLKAGKPVFPVSVNISRVSLYNPRLTELLAALVQKYEVSPALLQLEITGSTYMTSPELMGKAISSLHTAGFTITLDNFGSDYSSFSMLKQVLVDVLKIDLKSLPVEDETGRGEIILSSVIKMGRWLGMTVVVEGVETRRERDFLENAGCDYIQGYYYSRPIPHSDYELKYLVEAPQDIPGDAQPEAEDGVPQHNMTILVIDDSATSRYALQAHFKGMYHVHACASAEDGLAYLLHNAGRVRLIFVDNVMPGMSGMDFLRYCQRDSTLSAIPKIMITAADTVQDQVSAFREGAYDYITKPFIWEVVSARVAHIMEVSRRSTIFDFIEQEYEKKTELDPATQLLNKIAFKTLGTRIIDAFPDACNALLVLDIDDFKQVNDQYGHLVGDAVISRVSEELSSFFRKSDIIGRFGGDEFVVLMTKLPSQEVAKRKASELIKIITLACIRKLNISTSISIGISFSERSDTIDTMFARSDQALYEAKKSGKGKAVVYGEKIPPILNDDKPIVLVCGEDPQLYPSLALAYGDSALFASITNIWDLTAALGQYRKRVRVICIDMAQTHTEEFDNFYRLIREHGGGRQIPLLAVCREGDLSQLRAAAQLDILDILTLPPQADVIQRRLSKAIADSCAQ